jgi:uncharacterized membrane protein
MNANKSTALTSYIGVVGLLIAYLQNKNIKSNFISFHIRQSLGLSVCFFVLGYPIGSFDSWIATFIFWGTYLLINLYAITTVLTGSKKPIPFIGIFIQKTLKSIY